MLMGGFGAFGELVVGSGEVEIGYFLSFILLSRSDLWSSDAFVVLGIFSKRVVGSLWNWM